MSLVLLQPTRLPLRDRDLPVTQGSPAPLLLARRMAAGPAATDLLDRLRALPSPPSGTEQPEAADKARSYVYDDRLREYDAYFGVVRAGRHTDGVFARSLLIAYRSLLEEGLGAGTRLSWADWSSLCSALRTMICLSTGVDARPAAVPEPPLLRWHLDPLRRWRVGHHVFFALTQCVIVALQSFQSALEEADMAAARRNLRLATRLLQASAAAFVFTAEFSANQYHGGVRQSMEAPFVTDGFSGLLSPDHQYLVRLFARLRPALRGLPAELAADHRAFARALGTVYDSHKYVCRRFGGDTGPSLRTSDTTGLPAVSVLHALKLARTRIVGRT
ncbi:hypothetical protein ACIBIZ_14450 [Nonomuraea spiralis]|uniref:Uncharacterized protein n=1 Tax=Nonomuraea spiralis TaxID=46182 RepID=A0ABV5IWY2_9ACTN|nr:hypothetical protein [Nonomuraea spiralis]GGS82846.1 hypothetical protein GCM10010176_027930 [Nonomuraea spiralis]